MLTVCFQNLLFLQIFFQEHCQSVKRFGSRSGLTGSWSQSGLAVCIDKCSLEQKLFKILF